jgi:hypothetical protein
MKKLFLYVTYNLSKCIIFQIIDICISQKNPFWVTQICLLANIKTKVRYTTDSHVMGGLVISRAACRAICGRRGTTAHIPSALQFYVLAL